MDHGNRVRHTVEGLAVMYSASSKSCYRPVSTKQVSERYARNFPNATCLTESSPISSPRRQWMPASQLSSIWASRGNVKYSDIEPPKCPVTLKVAGVFPLMGTGLVGSDRAKCRALAQWLGPFSAQPFTPLPVC